MVREPVPALGGDHDKATLPDYFRGRRHSLHGLVQVLVEWKTGIGGDHDIEPVWHLLHGHGLSHGGSGAVHGEELAGERRRYLVAAVEHHVTSEVDSGRFGDGPDVVVDRVAFKYAPGGIRAGYPPGVVQRQRRLEPGQ